MSALGGLCRLVHQANTYRLGKARLVHLFFNARDYLASYFYAALLLHQVTLLFRERWFVGPNSARGLNFTAFDPRSR